MTRAFIDSLEPRKLLSAVAFEIDRKASQLDITAKLDVDHYGDVKLRAQADGLDTAPLTGTLLADITTKGVRFNSGSTIDLVEESGEFDPGNSSAAWALEGKVKKLGITLAEADAAFRDVSFDLSNTSRGTVDKKTKRFDFRNATMTATGGTVDYKLDSKFGDADGDEALDGLASKLSRTKAKLSGGAGSRAITIPILVNFERDVDGGTVKFTISGTIVGREKATAQAAAASVAGASTLRRNIDDVL